MAFKKKSCTITCATNAGSASVALGAAYARLIQVRAYGGTGTVVITVTDADGVVLYQTGAVDVLGTLAGSNTFGLTATGLAPFGFDSMLKDGTIATDQSGGGPVGKSPLTVALTSATGATDVITVDHIVEV